MGEDVSGLESMIDRHMPLPMTMIHRAPTFFFTTAYLFFTTAAVLAMKEEKWSVNTPKETLCHLRHILSPGLECRNFP